MPSSATPETPPHAPNTPRDAAPLIIVDSPNPHSPDPHSPGKHSAGQHSASTSPRFLMGRRRPDLTFMPGRFVFPGGRVDDADATIPAAREPAKIEMEKILAEMRGTPHPNRARALAFAAIRETFEETGLLIGQPHPAAPSASTNTAASPTPPPVGCEDAARATEHPVWQAFLRRGFLPDASTMTLFARAITPPGRPRRYDTRFFCVPRTAIAFDTGVVDEELSEIDWYTPEDTINLDLPPITRIIIEDLADRMKAGPIGPSALPVPFYHVDERMIAPKGAHANGSAFRRDILRAPSRHTP